MSKDLGEILVNHFIKKTLRKKDIPINDFLISPYKVIVQIFNTATFLTGLNQFNKGPYFLPINQILFKNNA